MNHFSETVSIDSIISQIDEAENRVEQLKQLLKNEKNAAIQDINRQIENKKAIIAKFNTELETLEAKLKKLNDPTPEPKREEVKKETETRKDNNQSLYELIEKIRKQSAGSNEKGGKTPWHGSDVAVYNLEDLIPFKSIEALTAKLKAAATKDSK